MTQNLKEFLKDFVGSRVSMTEQDRQANVKVANDIVDRFIACMKDMDPLFKELYQTIYYAGSFYEGLKVSDANEFDLNIILNLPFKPEEVQVVHENTPKGFVMYKLKQGSLENSLARHPKWPIFKDLDKLMDSGHMYISQNKLNAWFQSLVDKTLKAKAAQFQNVKRSCSGPAKTLNITSTIARCKLDVDLVPVIKLGEFPKSVIKAQQLNALPKAKSNCFIVPKPPPPHVETKYGRDAADRLFRVSIPDAERLLIEKKGCIKMLIKIFKAIRDKECLTFLPSYYIKTVFMWQLVKNHAEEFWKEDKLDKLFIMMLKEFIRVMTVKSLDHIFFNGYNLLAGLSQGAIDQAKIKFDNVLKHAESNVPKLYAKYGMQRNSVKVAAAPKA